MTQSEAYIQSPKLWVLSNTSIFQKQIQKKSHETSSKWQEKPVFHNENHSQSNFWCTWESLQKNMMHLVLQYLKSCVVIKHTGFTIRDYIFPQEANHNVTVYHFCLYKLTTDEETKAAAYTSHLQQEVDSLLCLNAGINQNMQEDSL